MEGVRAYFNFGPHRRTGGVIMGRGVQGFLSDKSAGFLKGRLVLFFGALGPFWGMRLAELRHAKWLVSFVLRKRVKNPGFWKMTGEFSDGKSWKVVCYVSQDNVRGLADRGRRALGWACSGSALPWMN